LENIKTKSSKSTWSATLEQLEKSAVLQSEIVEIEMNPTQEVESCLVHSGPKITKVVKTESDTGEVSDTKLTELEVE